MVHGCCAYGCSNRFKKGSGLGFFRFPRKGSRLFQWLHAVRRKNFLPTTDVRICGKHFITGRPSLNPHHPDYVPTIFSFRKDDNNNSKYGSRKKELCDPKEIPIFSYNIKDENTDDSESEDSEEEYDIEIKPEPDLVPEFVNSPLISVETVKTILNNETSDSSDPSSNTPKRNSKSLFTFIDVKGQIIARFSQKLKKKKTHLKYPQLFPESNPVETVQIIVDKKRAQTVAVNKITLCPAKNKELCKCNNRTDKLDDIDNDYYPVTVKVDRNGDENEDIDNLYLELSSLEQQKKELESKIQDKLLVHIN